MRWLGIRQFSSSHDSLSALHFFFPIKLKYRGTDNVEISPQNHVCSCSVIENLCYIWVEFNLIQPLFHCHDGSHDKYLCSSAKNHGVFVPEHIHIRYFTSHIHTFIYSTVDALHALIKGSISIWSSTLSTGLSLMIDMWRMRFSSRYSCGNRQTNVCLQHDLWQAVVYPTVFLSNSIY